MCERTSRRAGRPAGSFPRLSACLLPVLLVTVLVSLASHARAQPRPPRPETLGRGYALGAFLVLPSVAFDNYYDDNIFASERDEVDDYFVAIFPGLEIESNWSQHYLGLSAFGQLTRYATVTSEDNDQYALEAEGRLDITDASQLRALLGQGRTTVGRANSENSGRKNPQQLDFADARLGYDHEFARFDLDLQGFVERLDFLDSIDGDRDRIQFGGSSRLAYRFSPAFSVFVEPGVEARDYDQRVDNNGFERSSVTVGAFVGAKADITSILRGELALGPVHVGLEDPTFDDVTTLGARGELTWDVTALTSLELGFARRLAATTIDGASTKIQTLASIEARHELLENFILRAGATYFREEFKELGRLDDNFRIRLGAEYVINRFFTLTLGYRFRMRDTNAPRRDFDKSVVLLGFDVRL